MTTDLTVRGEHDKGQGSQHDTMRDGWNVWFGHGIRKTLSTLKRLVLTQSMNITMFRRFGTGRCRVLLHQQDNLNPPDNKDCGQHLLHLSAQWVIDFTKDRTYLRKILKAQFGSGASSGPLQRELFAQPYYNFNPDASMLKQRHFHPLYDGMGATMAPSALDTLSDHLTYSNSLFTLSESLATPAYLKAANLTRSNSTQGSGGVTPGIDGGWDAFIDGNLWEDKVS